jgi:CubicO group peptidase (beta-lactamase class C family)
MKKVLLSVFLLCVFLLLPTTSSSQIQILNQKTQTNYDFTLVNELLENAVETISLDGCVLLLIQDEEVIFEKAFGSYSLNTVVPIASATKWISAVLILDLVDDGLLSLDDKVSDWIPSFKNRGDKDDITIRQCFSHTSGLPSTALCLNYQQPPWTLEMCADDIAGKKMKEPPGTSLRYGGASMQVAGRVAELAGEDSWINLYDDRVAGPLGMDSLVWDNDYQNTANPRIAGGIDQITVYDYAKLLQMLMNGGTLNGVTIMSPETVSEMFKDQTMGVPVASSPYDGRNDFPHLGYSVGAWIDTTDELNEVVELSSTGAWGFHPWIDLERDIIGVFLVKSTLRKVFDVEVELRMLIREITSENKAANIPEKPNGPLNGEVGEKYSYFTSTTDPEGENISYLFDWGDGTNSGWTEYVPSGTIINVSHTWSKGFFNIRVKAKDSHGTESRWSEPLPVSMPRKNKAIENFLMNHPNVFPILWYIFGLQ